MKTWQIVVLTVVATIVFMFLLTVLTGHQVNGPITGGSG